MAEKKAEKCAHPGCECRAAKDSKYCSEYCAMVTLNYLSIACECGHAECAAGEAVGKTHIKGLDFVLGFTA